MTGSEIIEGIFSKGGKVVDIGGSLRIERSNKSSNIYKQYLNDRTTYIVLDKVPTYNPHIVADIRNMPFKDNSVDAFVCWRVIECVEEPVKAVDEMYRCLKKGGVLTLETLFIHHYFSVPGYYHDFYRFSEDGIRYLLRDFSRVTIEPICGPIETLAYLVSPKYAKHVRLLDNWRGPGRNVRGHLTLAQK